LDRGEYPDVADKTHHTLRHWERLADIVARNVERLDGLI
jgi:hypothetical protein